MLLPRMSSVSAPEPIDSPRDEFAQSLKARDVEGPLDLLFYRPVGLRLARFFAACRLTPDHVTLLGTIAGVLAGHLYFYRALSLNVVGMVLHITANLLDNVDGQLARLTKRQSETGKVIDGIGDYLVFLSVYVHLSLRFVAGGGSQLIWSVALAAALCHGVQSAAAEFSRDAYARFASGRSMQLQSSRALRARKKLLMRLHAQYAATQERALPALALLRDHLPPTLPDWFAQEYRATHSGVPRRSRLLGTNTRMLAIFAALLLRQPLWYFVFEIAILNVIFIWLRTRENSACRRLLEMISERGTH
jgi:phosphatidylglycerophosphate synthase